jgi:hypothetical protein
VAIVKDPDPVKAILAGLVKDPHPVKAVLVARGISNRALAILTNRSEWAVSRFLNRRSAVPADFAERVADLLELPVADLFWTDDQLPPRGITTESEVRAFVEASRMAAGLPIRISDVPTLTRVAEILAAGHRGEVV